MYQSVTIASEAYMRWFAVLLAALALAPPASAATVIAALHAPERITLGLAGIVTKVTCPADTRSILYVFEGSEGRLTYSGVTDGGAIGTDYIPIPAGALVELRHAEARWGKSHNTEASVVYLAAANGSTVVSVTCYQAGD